MIRSDVNPAKRAVSERLIQAEVCWTCNSVISQKRLSSQSVAADDMLSAYTPVTPNCDFTATFSDFTFGLVAVGRCVVAFNRRLAVTPKHRSQQIAVFLRYSKS